MGHTKAAMKTIFLTIVLDGMPFISWIYPELRKLSFKWEWHIVEGVALPEGDTKWVAKLEPRLSADGTGDYLDSITDYDPRVIRMCKEEWPGKTAMYNHALSQVKDRNFILWQIDADEVWTAAQLELGHALMQSSQALNCAYFKCRYFVGPNLVITKGNYGNRTAHEWRRVWKLRRGDRFATHEPPVIANFEPRPWEHNTTESVGLVFDHFALATEAQVAFKARYYGSTNNKHTGHLYKNAVEGWRRLQRAPMPVAQLGAYLPWVGEGVVVDKI